MEPLELLFTNENKKALESRWYLPEVSKKREEKEKNRAIDTQDKVATH